jgi:hypothetical protein
MGDLAEIRHWSYFPTREAQERFAAAVTELRYWLEHTHDDGAEPNRFCVCFSKLQSVDDLEEIWQRLQELSAGCDGVYDGHEFAVDDDEPSFSLN